MSEQIDLSRTQEIPKTTLDHLVFQANTEAIMNNAVLSFLLKVDVNGLDRENLTKILKENDLEVSESEVDSLLENLDGVKRALGELRRILFEGSSN